MFQISHTEEFEGPSQDLRILRRQRGGADTLVTKYNLIMDFEGGTEASVTVGLIFTSFSSPR